VSGWTAKRFWTEARVTDGPGGFAVFLDARPVKTPAKAPLVVPTRAMAEVVAAEWNAQERVVRPQTMPVTRAANSAIDTVIPSFGQVVGMLAEYGGSDLLCYRAETPVELVRRQQLAWDPLIDWAATQLGAPLSVISGVMHVTQDPASLARLEARLATLDPFRLTAAHDLVSLSGSLVLALALIHGRLGPEDAWALSRIDEDWQAEVWGLDDEAEALGAARREAFLQADRFYRMCG
jgi:chaperone required for assembly of F1-ATPase